jgi:predicted N-formylglutamate amidohydrolase
MIRPLDMHFSRHTVDNENGKSPFLSFADHAGKYFPRRLGQLGLSNADSGERATARHPM